MRRPTGAAYAFTALTLALLGGGAAHATPRPGFDWPLAGSPTVDRPFEPPLTDYGRGHRGVDLRADPGDGVLAAGAGRVTYAALLAGRGVVAVTHADGLRTTYEPVSAAVTVGERVRQGDILGELATGHGSCRIATTCLHWGLRRGTEYLDPLALVDPGPRRLLPLRNPQAPASTLRAARGTGGPPAPDPGRLQAVGAVGVAGSLATGALLLARRRRRG